MENSRLLTKGKTSLLRGFNFEVQL